MHRAVISRRLFLTGAVGVRAPAKNVPKPGAAYAFATAEYDVNVTVDFYDRYSTGAFSFRDLSAGRSYCLSANGEENRDCASGFSGALAIAHYDFRPRSELRRISKLREHVCTIDLDNRLPYRPPLDRTIDVRDGVASDIQAFGYEAAPTSYADPHVASSGAPWYYLRQDLFIEERPTALIVVHWRHTPNAIRILDVIPGEGTWAVKQRR